MYDVYFFSYDEEYAEKNWKNLKTICPEAKRIHGIKGISSALKKAASESSTSHFFSVDADNSVLNSFKWNSPTHICDEDKKVRIWRCRNIVNGLVYGHGAIKLWSKHHVLEANQVNSLDFTSASSIFGFEIQNELASETIFNSSPYSSWKAAFRECAKLASNKTLYVGTGRDLRTDSRLSIWMSLGADVRFGQDCILGARMGALYGHENKDDFNELLKINNTDYTTSLFEQAKSSEEKFLFSLNEKLRHYQFRFCDLNEEQSYYLKNNDSLFQ